MTSDKPPTDPTTPELRSTTGAVTEGVSRAVGGQEDSETCSFCGRGPSEINALVTKNLGTGSVKICDLCVNAARAQLQDP